MFRVVLSAIALAMSVSGSVHAAVEVRVHGHRGARAMRPENTLPAFEYAIKAGVDVLELDMAVTKDNVIVVSHDQRLREHVDVSYHLDDGHLTETDVPADRGGLEPWRAAQ